MPKASVGRVSAPAGRDRPPPPTLSALTRPERAYTASALCAGARLAKALAGQTPNSNWKYGFQQSGNGYPYSLTQAELSTLVRQGKLIPGSLEWTK